MYKVHIRYVIYELRDGLLKEPKSHWSDYDLMFTNWFETQEQALEAIQNEPTAKSTLIVLPVAVKYWD